MSNNVESETSVFKVFVGNVPFQCSKEEFVSCFESMSGFVEADLVRRPNSESSRGFGFVSFSDSESAKSLMETEDLVLKDRTLRFSEYNEPQPRKSETQNLVFVRNVPTDTSEESLTSVFSSFGEVKGCRINTDRKTGNPSGSCVVEFVSSEGASKVLSERTVDMNDTSLDVYQFRSNSSKVQYRKNPATRNAYRAGFSAGRAVGYQEGLKSQSVSADE